MLQMVSYEDDPPHQASSLQLSPSDPAQRPFRASDYAHDNKKHLLLCASGSVATIKIPNILSALARHPRLSVRLILTPSARAFLAGQSAEQPPVASLLEMANVDGVHDDAAEWAKPWERRDPILHIELRRWSHLMVIAPLSANMLAKIVGGLADGLLASVVRAWDTTGSIDAVNVAAGMVPGAAPAPKRIVVAPSMNTAMWRQPITARQIRVLEEEWGVGDGEQQGKGKDSQEAWFEVLRPQKKELACGDYGDGAMREWKEIVKVIEERLGLNGGD